MKRGLSVFMCLTFIFSSCTSTLKLNPPMGVPRVRVTEKVENDKCWQKNKEKLVKSGFLLIDNENPDIVIEEIGSGASPACWAFFPLAILILFPGIPLWTIICDDSTYVIKLISASTGSEGVSYQEVCYEPSDIIEAFQKTMDKSPPALSYEPRINKTNSPELPLNIEAEDNIGMKRIVIYKAEKPILTVEPEMPTTILGKAVNIPLDYGENKIEIRAYDWLENVNTKKFKVIRTKLVGEEVAKLPPPSLSFTASPIDGNDTISGGKEEGIMVTVKNDGKGIAKSVNVFLRGDDFLLKIWGNMKEIGDVKPGETKTVIFSANMPTEVPRKVASIDVVVKEGRGYSPAEIKKLSFQIVPPQAKKEVVELIKDVDTDIPSGSIEGEGYAVVIGISRYGKGEIPGPVFARNDAEVFKNYLSIRFGIKERNIKLLLDEEATYARIMGALKEFLRPKRGLKVIYFAGHGLPKGEKGEDVFIVPYDGEPEFTSTLIPVKEIYRFAGNPEDKVLVFLDSCFSGAEGRSFVLAERALEPVRLPSTDAIIFAAAEGTQPAKDFKETRHGYFTYYTLLGLRGEADLNKDGWITTLELYQFVRDKVSDATNGAQVPVIKPPRNINILKTK